MAIYSSTVECLKLFHASQPTLASENDSFKTWSANIGAYQKGRFSLDTRLRDSLDIKTVVLDLLRKLADAIRTAYYHWKSAKLVYFEPVIDLETSRLDQTKDKESFDSSSSSDGDVLLQLVGKTSMLERTTSRIRAIINSLMRLSISIRDPAPFDRYRRSKKIDVSEFVFYDTEHVEQLFPNLETFLKERLVNAILARRQFLEYSTIQNSRYARDYDTLFSQENDETADDQSFGAQTQTSEILTTSPPPSNFEPSLLDKLNLRRENDQSDASSVISYASSTENSGRPKVPPPPEDAELGGDPFECPHCHSLVEMQNMHDWKRHVYNDLQPYVCTFEHCKEPDRLFESRRQWFEHELEHHRKEYVCIKGCGKGCNDLSSLRTHVKTDHPEMQQNSVNELISSVSFRTIGPDAVSACPFFCGEFLDSRKKIEKHIGNHQMDLALRALDTIVQDTNTGESSHESEGIAVVEQEPNRESIQLETLQSPSNVEDVLFPSDSEGELGITNIIIGISGKFRMPARAILDTTQQRNFISRKFLSDMKVQYPQFAPEFVHTAHHIFATHNKFVELEWTYNNNEALIPDDFYVYGTRRTEDDIVLGHEAIMARNTMRLGSAKLAPSMSLKLLAQNRSELSKPRAERTPRWFLQRYRAKTTAVKLGQIYHDLSKLEKGYVLTGKVNPGDTTSFREFSLAKGLWTEQTKSFIFWTMLTDLDMSFVDIIDKPFRDVEIGNAEITKMDNPTAYLLDNEQLRQQLISILSRRSSITSGLIFEKQEKGREQEKTVVFMVTGIIVAHDVVMGLSTGKVAEAKVPVEADVAAAGVPNLEAEASSRTEFRSTKPILFAYQGVQISLDRKSRLQIQYANPKDHNRSSFWA